MSVLPGSPLDNMLTLDIRLVLAYLLSLMSGHNNIYYVKKKTKKNTSSSGSSYSLCTTVKCGSDSPFLLLGNCMTYNSTTDVKKVGSCQYVQHLNTTSLDQFLYIQLPNNVSLLNELVVKTSPCTRLF